MSEAGFPAIGSRAPAFRLPASTGGEIGLADYTGLEDVVLFVYVKDDTSG